MEKNVYQIIAEKLISSIENANNWKQPFSFCPSMNAITRKPYKGVNQFVLAVERAAKGYSSSFYMTAKQANDLGGWVRKGEKSVQIVYYLIFYTDSLSGQTITEEQFFNKYGYYPCNDDISGVFPRYYNVFNVEQLTGLPDAFLSGLSETKNEKIGQAEDFLNGINANIKCGIGTAYYNKTRDFICLPAIDSFISGEAYYHVAFHELTHWTGHETRLNRPFGKYGDETYAIEELIAETSAAFLCEKLNINEDFNQFGAYLKSWLECLKKDAKHLFSIIPKAQTAADYLLQVAAQKIEEVQTV